jgi:hypothetical protein
MSDWRKLLQLDSNGTPLGNMHNVLLYLRNDPNLRNRLAYDSFNKRVMVLRPIGPEPSPTVKPPKGDAS